jgi:hypothetical protein
MDCPFLIRHDHSPLVHEFSGERLVRENDQLVFLQWLNASTLFRVHSVVLLDKGEGNILLEFAWFTEEKCHVQAAVAPTISPDQAAMFSIDFPSWLVTLGDRNRKKVADRVLGERTSAVAGKHAMAASRIAQLRRKFHRRWHELHGEGLPAEVAKAQHRGRLLVD